MDLTASKKLAKSIKRKSSMYLLTINKHRYMICFENNMFTARIFNKSDVCEKIYVMSEQTFVHNFLQGENINDNNPVMNSVLRNMDIYVPNNTRAFMLS